MDALMAKSAPEPTFELPLRQRFSYRMNLITRALSQQMLLRVSRKHGLNLAEYRIMTVLADHAAPSIRDIAAHSQLDKAQVTRALSDLTDRGLVTQVIARNDRRLRVVALTRSGRATIAATVPFSSERQRRLEARLSASELRMLWKVLPVLQDEAERMLAEEQGRDGQQSQAAATPQNG
jgi:DNA-binding MarR family transcriptional regulator